MSAATWLHRLDAIAPAVTDAALRGVVVFLLALAITHLMRRRTAAARHLVWVGAIVVQLALPLFALWGPQWQVAVPTAVSSVLPITLPDGRIDETRAPVIAPRPASPQAHEPIRLTIANDGAPTVGALSTTAAHHEPAPPARISGRAILLTLWLVGALIVLVRLAVGTTIVAALARRGARVEDGGWLSLAQRLSTSLQIARPLTLMRGGKVGVPITWGIVYPVVLLPDDADAWPEERRRFVLVHEMAHVKRLDALTQLAGQIALALFWFDPLVWIANRRMQLEREHACDDYVLRHGTAPSHYAEELLAMVRSLGTTDRRSSQPAFAALAMARRSEFEGRMLSILDPVLARHPLSKGRTLMSAFAALLLVVPLAALHPYHRAEALLARDTRVAVPTATDEFPESFKISVSAGNEPAARTTKVPQATAPATPAAPLAEPRAAFGALSAGMAKTAQQLDGMSKKLKLTTSPKTCDEPAVPGTTINAIHSDSHDGGLDTFRYMSLLEDGSCREATLVGHVTFTPAEDDIASMPISAHAAFRERTSGADRQLVVRAAEDGALTRIFRLNGAAASYDDDARRWFAGYLPRVLRESGMNVKPRVARWRAEGGVDRVLSMIATIRSPSAKRAHYEALLDEGRLSTDDLDHLVRQAGRDLNGSSGDLRAVLQKAAPGVRGGPRTVSALEAAVMGVPSSGDRTAVLQTFGQTTDRDMLLSVMKMAETIPSSGDKANLLIVLAPHYFPDKDPALRAAFFRTLATIPSSGDMRNVLSGSVMGYAAGSEDVARAVIRASLDIPSSGDRANVLLDLVNIGATRTAPLRDALLKATQGLASGDARNVLEAAARH
jgi:beta-lactamase regulating signal transducer with metallopeptidase domain